ncbi:AzlC family ABC transporter permease [Halonotius terrestris]|nr:AzlC family ABC transporter permease [Halonotius terrestris]
MSKRRREIDSERMAFSGVGLRAGIIAGTPVAVGVAGYGLVFGIIADRAGLSVAEAALMSATVLAGAAQLIAVELWTEPLPVVALLTTTAVVNLRYLLLGAALQPWLRSLSPLATYTSVFFVADENWALSIEAFRNGRRDAAFLLGSGIVLWLLWIVATVVGATAGEFIESPTRFGIDFVLPALFLTLAVGFWEGRQSVLPWAGAAGVGIAAEVFLPGKWYIICGALAGVVVAVVMRDA